MTSFKKKAADAQKRGRSEKCHEGRLMGACASYSVIIIAFRRAADI
jgi:hypothetical protein